MEHEVRAEKTSWWNHFLKSEFFYHYKNNLPAIIGSVLVLFAILTAVAGRFLAPQNPYDLTQISLMDSYLPPAWLDGGKLSFLLGTDEQDILSAIIYGSASSIMIGLVGMAASCCIGTTLGLIAGYFGGKVDAVIMRIADIQLSFPSMLIALFIMSVFGRGVGKLLIALTMVGWVTYARTVRGETLSVKKMEYVEAARSIGVKKWTIMRRHILPNCIPSLIVLFTLNIPSAILSESSLSFLGVGAQPPSASWGLMVVRGKKYLFSEPWLSLAPCVAIMIVVIAFNFLGDGLRDVLDPYLKEQ